MPTCENCVKEIYRSDLVETFRFNNVNRTTKAKQIIKVSPYIDASDILNE